MELIYLFMLLVLLAFLAMPLVALILAIVALAKIRDLAERIERLSRQVPRVPKPLTQPAESAEREVGETKPTIPPAWQEPREELVVAQPVAAPAGAGPPAKPPSAPAPFPYKLPDGFSWEMFIGRKALGWASSVGLFFSAAFFLRYAVENKWIGPLGQVSIVLLAGAALCAWGWERYRRGWRLFSQFLTAAGIVVTYLSIYASFGYYRLLPENVAMLFLIAVVVEAALLAVAYNAWPLALMSLIGGLLTPLLMHTDYDRYREFFSYLMALNLGVAVLAVWRNWRIISTAAILGTQGLFWAWMLANYHPDKWSWAIGLQLFLFAVYFGCDLLNHVFGKRPANLHDFIRLALVAGLGFGAAYALLLDDYEPWLGTLAVAMSAVYVGYARLVYHFRRDDWPQLFAALAIAIGFFTLAIPLQAEAQWVSLAWAATAAALWQFGWRVRSPALRGMGAALGVLAVCRLLAIDTPWDIREPFVPIFNKYGLPALGVCACVLYCAAVGRKYFPRMNDAERAVTAAGAVGGIVLLWLVLSMETYGYFTAMGFSSGDQITWNWMGQMALSILWGVYASLVLAIGFRRRAAWIRWTALAFFALTAAKVLLVDMAEVQQIYRILAFFVVALLLGAAGWGYQRFQRNESLALKDG